MIAETAEAEWVAVIWSVGLKAFGFFFGQAEGKGDAAVCKEGVVMRRNWFVFALEA